MGSEGLAHCLAGGNPPGHLLFSVLGEADLCAIVLPIPCSSFLLPLTSGCPAFWGPFSAAMLRTLW